MSYPLLTGRPAEAVQQMERALREDPLNSGVRFYEASCLLAAGREEDASKELREVLEFNLAHAGAYGYLGYQHLLRGELDQALVFVDMAYTLGPQVPNAIGALAGLLKRAGDTRRAEELLLKLQPGDAYGAPRDLAFYHWVLREFDAAADWIEKAIDQYDPNALTALWVWWERDLRSTPRWAQLMRKLNLPES
jgi:tetratricopeptide (TPR) repeat protein